MIRGSNLPMKVNIGDNMPTRQDRPIFPQLPPSVNSVNTADAEFFGASTQSGIKITKKPTTCRNRQTFSTRGKYFTKSVLKMIANKVIAITSNVPCQRSNV